MKHQKADVFSNIFKHKPEVKPPTKFDINDFTPVDTKAEAFAAKLRKSMLALVGKKQDEKNPSKPVDIKMTPGEV